MIDKTSRLDTNNRTNQIGLTGTRGGAVVLDEYFTVENSTIPEECKYISLGTGGTLVLEMMDGNCVPLFDKSAGSVIATVAKRVLSSHDFNGKWGRGVVTTTATDMTWWGGM